jgi:hypothetical protein
MLGSGCAFFSKEVQLKSIPCSKAESGALKGLNFSVVVKDGRENEPEILGATPWSLADVTTKDSVPDWIAGSLAERLKCEGAQESKRDAHVIRCIVKALDASFGFWSTINTNLAIDVAVIQNGKVIPIGLLSVEHSPFTWFVSSGAYEEAIFESLSKWLEKYSPEIVATLKSAMASLKKKKIKKEPTTLPEKKTIEKPPPPPELLVTSHKTGEKVQKSDAWISGYARYANEGELELVFNGTVIGSLDISRDQQRYEFQVEFRMGKNNIQLILRPKKGEVLTQKLTITFEPPPVSDLYSLILAVEKYSLPGLSALPDSGKMAEGVGRILKNSLESSRADRIVTLPKNASDKDFRSKLKQMFSSAGWKGSVVVFYSGSVTRMSGELAFTVAETDRRKPTTAILLSDIEFDIGAYFVGKTVLIISCGQDISKEQYRKLVHSSHKLTFLHYFPPGGKTDIIVSALEGKADRDGNGYVTLGELRTCLGTENTIFKGDLEEKFVISRVKGDK